MPTKSAVERKPPTIIRRLAILVIAAMLPLLAFAIAMILHYAQDQRTDQAQQLLATTRAVSAAIDAEIARQQAILTTLRASWAFRSHDWRLFHDVAKAAIANEPDARIAVCDPSGQIVLSTFAPFGTDLPHIGAPEDVRRVVDTGQPFVSDLFVGALSKTYVVSVYLPVIENGTVAYVLVLASPTDRISGLLARNVVFAGGTGSVIDRKGIVLARTKNAEKFVGQSALPDFIDVTSKSDEGVFDLRNLDGMSVHGIFTKSGLSDWTVTLTVDQAALDAPLWRVLRLFGGGGVLLVGVAVFLAFYQGRRIAGPVAALAAMAASLGRGERIQLRRLGLMEAQAIADQLSSAADTLQRQSAERENLLTTLERRVQERTGELKASEAKHRQLAGYSRSLIEASLDPLVTISAEGKITDVNKATEEATGYSRAQLIGTDFADYFTDPDKARDGYREVFEKGSVTDYPLALRHRSGAVMDVLYNASVYRDEKGAIAGVFAAARDVTARRQAEAARARSARALRMLNACNSIVIHASDENRLLADICRTVVEIGGYKLAWVGYAEKDETKSVRPMAYAGADREYVEHAEISWADTERGRGPTGSAIRTGQVTITRDTETDPCYGPWRERAIEKGYRSSATMPLKADATVYGALIVYAGEPGAFDAEETELLAELADDLAYATAALRTKAAREAAEQELRSSRARLDLALRSADMGAWHWDIAENKRYFDAQVCHLLGIDPATFTGAADEFFGALHPDDRTPLKAALARTIEQDVLYEPEYRAVWPDGSVHNITARGRLVRDDKGRPARVIGVIWDITEKKLAEQDLRRASLYARSLIEASLDPLVTISPEGKVTDVNKATEEVTGYSRAQLIGTDFADYFTEPEKARAGYRKVFSKGFVTDYPLAIRHVSGKVIDVLYNANVYRDENGNIAGVFAAARDITERKRAEEEIRRASLYARSLIEASLDPLVTISPEGKVTDVNKATEEVTGYSRAQLIGTDFADYFTEPEKARAGYRKVFSKGFVTDYPLAIRHVSGKVIDVLYNANVYRDENGNIAGVFAAARDITERKRAEEELAKHREHLEELVEARTADLTKANALLEAANKELESFSYSVSHDLRVPLRAIDGFSLMLLEDYAGKLDADGQRLLNVVRDSTKKMSQLIDDILAFSRIGRQDMAAAEVDMNALAREALEQLGPAMAGRDIKIDIAPLPPTHGDAAMLRRIWSNLLDNAVKFTKPKPNAAIEVGARTEPGETVYFVKDNGVGFDMQYVGKLFGVFQRLHGPEEFPGTGIGLALVKRIVVRHGGRVWAEGKVDEGASVYFALPAKEGDHA